MAACTATTLANTPLKTCIYNASGCLCTSLEQLMTLDSSKSGAILTKSSTLKPRIGNAEPRLALDNKINGSINSMGIPNYGYVFYDDCRVHFENKPYIQSIYPFNREELKTMLKRINDNVIYLEKHLVELNLSCPNLEHEREDTGKSIVGYDYQTFEEYLQIIRDLRLENLTIGIKLPPYYEAYQFERVATILLKFSDIIKFIVCINSMIGGLLIDPSKEQPLIKNIYGGIGGIYAKPIALSNVSRFYKLLGDKIDIVGCGGVQTGQDIFELILCGAKAVQVGTCFLREGIICFHRLDMELKDIMIRKGYKTINEFRGNIHKARL